MQELTLIQTAQNINTKIYFITELNNKSIELIWLLNM